MKIGVLGTGMVGTTLATKLASLGHVDVANPLDFSKGMPPSLFTGSNDSLGERIQKAFPDARVVKALNTVNANVMVDPGRVPGVSDVFVCGNDAGEGRGDADPEGVVRLAGRH
jgi:8-hydroxy-5-deazaflavin:NADPH oxidoreductase